VKRTLPLIVGFVTLLGGCREPKQDGAPVVSLEKRPDIVLVVVDTLRADHLGTYGYRRPTSPQIDAIGAEGIVFEQAYTHSSWTLPSTASLLTGQLPHQHRLARSTTHEGQFGKLDPATPTIASRLSEEGYRTAAFINNAFLTPELGLNKGFDRYDYRGAWNNAHRTAKTTVEAAVQWLDESAAEAPAFLLVHLFEPHLSYIESEETSGTFVQTTPEYPESLLQDLIPGVFPPTDLGSALMDGTHQPNAAQIEHLLGLYDEEVLLVDRAIGALTQALKQRGRWENTLFMLTSDHGEEFWDHGKFEHGHSLFGELVRVPLIVRAPGVTPRRVSAPARGVDVYQTALAAAQITERPAARGRDLRNPSKLPPEAAVVHENTLYGPQKAAITQAGYRFIINMNSGEGSLWAVDLTGQRDAFVEELNVRNTVGRSLFDDLRSIRGDLKPFVVEDSSTALSGETVRELLSLGYLE